MLLDDKLLDRVSADAKASPRLRMNYNLHESLEAPVQRMLNALEPGTELPIHRHRHTAETYTLLRGRMKVIFYDEKGRMKEEFLLDPAQGVYGVNIPIGTWHGVEVLESAVILEVKEGPYQPIAPEDVME
jgi:cupin fold WbuC family metalloprotein